MDDFAEWESDPDLIFEQTERVYTCSFYHRDEPQHFLVFARNCRVWRDDRLRKGVSLLIFECHADGEADWKKRYQAEDRDFDRAWSKFRFRFVNGLVNPEKPAISRPLSLPTLGELKRLNGLLDGWRAVSELKADGEKG